MSTQEEITLEKIGIREINDSEKYSLLDAIFEITGEKSYFEEYFNNKRILQKKGRSKIIYICSESQYNNLIISSNNFPTLKVNLIGQQLGIMRGHRCSLGIEFVHILSKKTKKGIILNDKGSNHLIYGNNITEKHVKETFGEISNDTRILLLDESKKALGIGNVERIHQNDEEALESIEIKNLVDIGVYLRSEKRNK